MYKLISITDKKDNQLTDKLHKKYIGSLVESIEPTQSGGLLIKCVSENNKNKGMLTTKLEDVWELPDENETVIVMETENSRYYFVEV